jgi:MFS family permease
MNREAPPGEESALKDEELATEAAGVAVEHERWRGATFRALRHRNYRLYFLGQMVSLVGSWMQTTALLWLTDQLTHEARWTTAVAAATMLPAFFFGAWGGLLTELRPRRAIIIWTQSALLLQALLLAALVKWGNPTPWALLAMATASGLINAVDLPARLGFVVEMANREDLPNAVALNSMLFNVARAVGPLLTGTLLTTVGPALCFFLNSLSFVAVIVALVLMRLPAYVPAPAKHLGLRAILAAFAELVRRPHLGVVLGLVAMMSVFGWPSQALLPKLAREGLKVTEDTWGYPLLLCGAGMGAVLAALTAASLTSERWRRPILCGGIALAATGLLGLSIAPGLPVAIVCNGLVGFGLILFMATSQSVVQLGVDDGNRGRIMGIWSMVLNGAVPLGNLLAGPAADWWTVPVVLGMQGVGCTLALAVAVGCLRLREKTI